MKNRKWVLISQTDLSTVLPILFTSNNLNYGFFFFDLFFNKKSLSGLWDEDQINL